MRAEWSLPRAFRVFLVCGYLTVFVEIQLNAWDEKNMITRGHDPWNRCDVESSGVVVIAVMVVT